MVTQLVPEVNVTAPEQTSFAGGAGSVTHILNVPDVFGSVYTLIKYVLPMVRPLAVSVPVAAQETEVKEAQVPEKSWMRGFAGAEDKVIVGVADCATKLYHTSFLLATPQPIVGMVV